MFTTCSQGHDLTAPNAYVYRSGGRRECRECATPPKTKRQRSLGTWNDKIKKVRDTFV